MMINNPAVLNRYVLIVLIVFLVSVSWLPAIDHIADADIDAGFNRALVSFGIAKGLNMVISLLQSTQFSAQPLGVGIAMSPGELLDPINDLVEQFANFMLLASVAFGIQKILIVIGGHTLVKSLLSALGLAAAWFLYKDRPVPHLLKNALIMIILVRLAVPAATMMSNMAYEIFLEPQYQESTSALGGSKSQIESLKPDMQEPVASTVQEPAITTDQATTGMTTQEPAAPTAQQEAAPPVKKSLWSKTKSLWSGAKSLVSNFTPPSPAELMQTANEKINGWSLRASQIGEDITRNVVNQIVVFLLQTLIFPIGMIWVLYRVGLSLMYRKK